MKYYRLGLTKNVHCLCRKRAGTVRGLVVKERTRDQVVMGSIPSTEYWMDIFSVISCKIVFLLELAKNKRNRGRGWAIS